MQEYAIRFLCSRSIKKHGLVALVPSISMVMKLVDSPENNELSEKHDGLERGGHKAESITGSISELSIAAVDHDELAPLAVSHRFQDPEKAQCWHEIHSNVGYGGLHHFDPDFVWTKKEERKALWHTEFSRMLRGLCVFCCIGH